MFIDQEFSQACMGLIKIQEFLSMWNFSGRACCFLVNYLRHSTFFDFRR
jgi:hypothetical protein